jgi:hypothetical protein
MLTTFRSSLPLPAAWLPRCCIPILLAFVSVSASAAPITVVDNGPAFNRINIVFLGDGYTQADIDAGIYDRDIQSYLGHLFDDLGFLSDPFGRYDKFFNVYKVNVVSTESGADIPYATPPISVSTALDASYNFVSGTTDDRLLTVSDAKANIALSTALSGTNITADMQLVTVNSSKYGGSGGTWAVYAGGNQYAREIALHETGHTFAGLADEYGGYTTPYAGAEPAEPDATKDPTGAKWSRWLGFQDPRGSELNIGVYQGAEYYDTGLYRPSYESKMRDLNVPFNAVSREAFILNFYKEVHPLDSWLSNSAAVTNGDLWVQPIDTNVIETAWYVDNVLVPGATSTTFDPADFGFGAGTYQVRAHSYDRVLDHAFDGGLLDLVRTQFDLLEEDITWTFKLTASSLTGDYYQDGVVDAADYIVWRASVGSVTNLAADGNHDGLINSDDYDLWRLHFGEGSTAGIGVTPVPEPPAVASWVIAVVMPFATGLRGSRRTISRDRYIFTV